MYSLTDISQMIQNIPNFPKKGVLFRDITPILENAKAFKSLIKLLVEMVPPQTTKLLTPESRGFLLASAMTQYLDVGIIVARKPGKLPRQTYSQEYQLEYGTSSLHIHKDSLQAKDKVTLVDDVLASGGTAQALESICLKAKTNLIKHCFFIEIVPLKGQEKLKIPSSSLLKV